MEMDNLNNNIEENANEKQATDTQNNEKMYTKSEVTEIVNKAIKKRLAREKEKPNEPGADEAALKARSAKLDCREYVIDNGLPKELLDVINTDDVEAFKEKAEKMRGVIEANIKKHSVKYPEVEDNGEVIISLSDNLSSAFSKGVKHKPKDYYGK